MERVELNIPSKFSHARFEVGKVVNTEGKVVSFKENDINYFYSIIYLYRYKLLGSNADCLKKEKEEKSDKTSHSVNVEKIDWDKPINISFYNISAMIEGGKHSSDYTLLRDFVNHFMNLKVVTNLFGKDKSEPSKTIKIFDSITIGENCSMDVKINKEYILPYLVTEKLFKKVVLNVLYGISGKYTKTLYLMCKDYVGVKSDITMKELSNFLGKGFVSSRLSDYLKDINNHSDIKVTNKQQKFGKKADRQFIIKSQQWFLDEEEEYEYDFKQYVWKEAQREATLQIENGIVVEDSEKYTKGIFKNKIKTQRENYKNKFDINSMLDNLIVSLKSDAVSKNDSKAVVVFKLDYKKQDFEGFVIGDDYKLYGYPFPTPITKNIKETMELIEENFKSEFVGYIKDTDKYKMSRIQI